jgi:hypothetical protein
MATEDAVTTEREKRLDEIIAEYLDRLASGGSNDPVPWLDRYPEFHDELSEFFRDHSDFEKVASQIREDRK